MVVLLCLFSPGVSAGLIIYDFQATVTESDFASVAAGQTIRGALTFDENTPNTSSLGNPGHGEYIGLGGSADFGTGLYNLLAPRFEVYDNAILGEDGILMTWGLGGDALEGYLPVGGISSLGLGSSSAWDGVALIADALDVDTFGINYIGFNFELPGSTDGAYRWVRGELTSFEARTANVPSAGSLSLLALALAAIGAFRMRAKQYPLLRPRT